MCNIFLALALWAVVRGKKIEIEFSLPFMPVFACAHWRGLAEEASVSQPEPDFMSAWTFNSLLSLRKLIAYGIVAAEM